MKIAIVKRVASVLAVAFSLLTLVEGSQVLLGVTESEYIVLKPLLIYNVLMAIVGIVAGVALWFRHRWSAISVATVAAAHGVVLLIIGVMYVAGGSVALHSVQAMGLRCVIWCAAAWVAWKA